MTKEEFIELIKKTEGCCGHTIYNSLSKNIKFNDEEILDLLYLLTTDEDYKDILPVINPLIKIAYQSIINNDE